MKLVITLLEGNEPSEEAPPHGPPVAGAGELDAGAGWLCGVERSTSALASELEWGCGWDSPPNSGVAGPLAPPGAL